MATNFTVILFSRLLFGPSQNFFKNVGEQDCPYAGLQKNFSFDCPNIDASQPAYLMFQSFAVGDKRTVFQINGLDIFGGLPVSNPEIANDRTQGENGANALWYHWSGNIMLVESNHELQVAGNQLHVESTGLHFIIDNVVITYKTIDTTIDSGPFKPPFPPPIRKRKSPAKRSTRD